MAGAIHRFHPVGLALPFPSHAGVHVLGVRLQVTRASEQLLVRHVRGEHELVILGIHQVLDPPAKPHLDPGALRMPAYEAGPDVFLEAEQVEILAELAVIPAAGFLEAVGVRLQGFLLIERRAVDALQHLSLLVPSPVGTGRGKELEVPHLIRGRHVWATAQIQKRPVTVDGDDLVVRNLGESFELQRIVREQRFRVFAAHFLTLERDMPRSRSSPSVPRSFSRSSGVNGSATAKS